MREGRAVSYCFAVTLSGCSQRRWQGIFTVRTAFATSCMHMAGKAEDSTVHMLTKRCTAAGAVIKRTSSKSGLFSIADRMYALHSQSRCIQV